MNPIEKLVSELKRLQTGYREESYYRPLCEFLESYASNREFLHMINVVATNNPGSGSVGEGVGFPDIEVKQNRRLIGYIEVKPPNQNLNNPAFSTQFNKYKESLENIVFTNFKKWQLYTWDQDGKTQKTAEADWDFETDLSAESVKKLLTNFFEGQSYQAKTPHQLAIALARKTKLLSQLVQEALTSEHPDKRLVDLKKTFEKTLIQDIGDHQFANIYAETITYSLFLAKLEHFEKGSSGNFTLRTAVDYLPKSVPIFRDLYQLTGGTVKPITPEIYNATEILIEQLNFADIEKIYRKLVEHKPGEDPVIQFYEPFLSEYDPKEREARGVYYTPKPVVDYIVRSVDYILKTKFNKPKGLGDNSVQILDPATGTGTFLMSAIQNIYADIEKKNKPLGDQAIQREFNDVVSKHILKHIYGFELLVAPYAVAHLKLTLELERLGFNFSMTSYDEDKDNDRLKIYLANTLDDPNKPPQSLFGFESIAEESEEARKVKKDEPILVITGNPPYSNFGRMNRGQWILDLLKDYKKDLNERKINLDDDFIKFIRFAQWKLEQTGQGVFAMITNNTYIDGITHRQMRRNLMDTFDEMYIYNLHGNSRKGETAPDGGKDENVFNIQQGVSINIFVKYPVKKKEVKVKYADLWGLRKHKFAILLDEDFGKTKWQTLVPKEPYWFFVNREKDKEEYLSLWKISDVLPLQNSGIQTDRDGLIFDIDKINLIQKLKRAFSGSFDAGFGQMYRIRNSSSYNFADRLRNQTFDQDAIISCFYRPFDKRWAYYKVGFTSRPAYEVMRHMTRPNLALQVCRQLSTNDFRHVFVSSGISERCLVSLKTKELSYVHPIYLYENPAQASLLENRSQKPNVSPDFAKLLSDKLGLEFVYNGQGDLKKTFGPEDIFYYAYSVFHSPTYRTRYAEQLKIDFPRLPLTSNKELFKKLVHKGKGLVNLHLIGENPFDKSKTILDDTSKWHVKIGGEKSADLEDWMVTEVRYDEKTKRVYVNPGQYFEGIEKEVWKFMVGGYQVLDKWLKDRKKPGRVLSPDDTTHYMKIVVSLRETIRIMKEIDQTIPRWPIE